jgi:hypothetical protein
LWICKSSSSSHPGVIEQIEREAAEPTRAQRSKHRRAIDPVSL